MPVTGQQSFAQFAGAINQQHATAAQFATAMAHLKQAEDQFKIRQEHADKVFQFEKERWGAEKGLLDMKLKRLEFENNLLQQDAEQQKLVPGAFSKLATSFGAIVKAATTGDQKALGTAQEQMSKTMAEEDVAKVAGTVIPLMRNTALTLGFSEQLVTKNFGAAAGTTELLEGSEYLKFQNNLKQQLMRNMTGKTDEELQEEYTKKLGATNQLRHNVVAQISAQVGQLRAAAEGALAGPEFRKRLESVLNGNSQDFTPITNSLQQARGQAKTADERTKIDGMIEQLRQLQLQNEAVRQQHVLDLQKQEAADTISQALVAKYRATSLTKGGSTVSAASALQASEPVAASLASTFDYIAGSKHYNTYMATSDADTADQALTTIMGEVAQRLPDDTLQNMVKQGLMQAKKQYGSGFVPGPGAAATKTRTTAPPAPPNTGTITFRR